MPQQSLHVPQLRPYVSRSVVSSSLLPSGYSLPGSSVHGILRQEHWSGLPFPSSGDLPNPGIEPRSPALYTGSFPLTLCSQTNNQTFFKKVKIGEFSRTQWFTAKGLGLIPSWETKIPPQTSWSCQNKQIKIHYLMVTVGTILCSVYFTRITKLGKKAKINRLCL